MLINFDLGSGPFASRPKFKGGRWKDKQSAKRSFLHGRQKHEARAQNADDPSPGDYDRDSKNARASEQNFRPSKRMRVDAPNSTNHSRVSRRAVPRGQASDGRRGTARGVVSSLFSYNPQPKTSETTRDADESTDVANPSNAPLKDELETFTSLGLTSYVVEHLFRKLEIKAPTAIQRAAIKQLMKEESDAFIQAETGSGKTLAYLLPIVQKIIALSDGSERNLQIHRDSGLFAIILAPTRELSRQISTVLERLLGCAHWVVSGIVTGGEKKKSEKARLRKGLNILIATPGRLADHLDHTEVLDVSNVRWVVLDEGDRLMELGFEKDIEKILSRLDKPNIAPIKDAVPRLPEKRTTILCSATLKSQVQRLGEISLKDAAHIHVTDEDLEDAEPIEKEDRFSAPAQLKQSYSVVPAKLRLVVLAALLKREFARRGSVMRAIIFLSCANSVDFHFDVLTNQHSDGSSDGKVSSSHITSTHRGRKEDRPQSDHKAKVGPNSPVSSDTIRPSPHLSTPSNPKVVIHRLHGSLPQQIRTHTLANFRDSPYASILICTDVASRGLDLPNVDLIIEYDPPFSRDDHLHRVGRTARAGNPGRATIFLLPGPEESYPDNVLRQAGRVVTRVDPNEILRKGFGSPGPGGGKDWEDRATEWQLGVERWSLENPKILEMARQAFESHVRAYATHVAAERAMFDMAELHLGHLAKAFGLRDRPGAIRVPGLRPGAGRAKAEKGKRIKASATSRKLLDRNAEDEYQITQNVDMEKAARKMEAKMKEQAAMSEYNLG